MDFTDSGFHFCASQYSSKDYFGGRTPVPIRVIDNEIDIAIGIYKKRNRTHISFIKLVFIEENDILKFKLIENNVDQPVLDNGKVGSYCENGIIPSCSISLENKFGLYTIGFDSRNNSIFHASSGLAFLDNNLKVTKHFSGPVLDRGPNDPMWAASPYVFKMANKFHMLYTSAFDYKFFDHLNKYHHVYDIKLRSSAIPENFNNNSISLIKGNSKNEYAVARPFFWKYNNENYIFYCKRESSKSKDYMIFYKSSEKELDQKFNNNKEYHLKIKNLNDKRFQTCQCYPYFLEYKNYLILFYNGEDYGKSGFRIAFRRNIL